MFFDNLFENYDWVKSELHSLLLESLSGPIVLDAAERWWLSNLYLPPQPLCASDAYHLLTALPGYLMGISELTCPKWSSDCLS